MFQLWRNQVVGFTSKCVKNICGRVTLSMTCIFTYNVSLSQVFFTDFAGKSHQPGFSVSGPLTENGLKGTLHGNIFCSGKIFTFKHDSYSRGPVVWSCRNF